ncbi:odorant receptor 4-like [Aphidius gifuensis]|uniref:odorant receptor 4-like n=1 Tax=Aphidius gifuensis TaxID=684658 RepID=UPI001CDCFF94|nr:odorant receptor 4-like [Aphidius gifuensis]
MADKINSIFTSVIFLQYSASSIIICTSIYLISQMPLFTVEFAALAMYLICMLIQIFLLCITGNEATLECSSLASEIYKTNWLVLSKRTKSYLILMMIRTRKPIVFTSGHIITLSLDSFKSLLKMSYSAYNLLQQSAN